jgi:hypothetical protein
MQASASPCHRRRGIRLLKSKPAGVAHRPASKSDQQHQPRLDSEVQSPSKERNANSPPAEDARPAPWADDDRAYFAAHPDNNERLRLPFPDEFPPCVLEPGGFAFVRITVIKRDVATGRPTRVARSLRFCSGGNA